MEAVHFARLTREQLRALAPDAIAVVPVGATEQHGPHLPVGTDTYAVTHIAWAAAELAADRASVVVTPTLPFGSSHHHLPFGGTISFSTEVYYRVVAEIVGSLIGLGFRGIMLLNGHGGNRDIIGLVARDLTQSHPVQIAVASYWEIAHLALLGTEWSDAGDVPGHAGRFESSVMLALRPAFVTQALPDRNPAERERMRPRPGLARIEDQAMWQAINGFTDSPADASGDAGDFYLDRIIPAVADAYVQLAAAMAARRDNPA